jgi:hypothetical protein
MNKVISLDTYKYLKSCGSTGNTLIYSQKTLDAHILNCKFVRKEISELTYKYEIENLNKREALRVV